MKKTLSILLAALMLASLTLTVSAGTVAEYGGTGYIMDVYRDGENPVLKKMYSVIQNAVGGEKTLWGTGETYYTSWYDLCPTCGGIALFYVKGGAICWQCVEKNTNHSGTIQLTTEDVNPSKPVKPFTPVLPEDDDPVRRGDAVCPDCGSSRRTVYIDTVVQNGRLQDRYYCSRCGILFNARTYTESYTDRNTYRVSVSCDHGSATVSGGTSAKYGDRKTVTFTADRGYTLTDVTVNGVSVAVQNGSVSFTVRGNTTVRGYFEKASSAKKYTVTASVIGGGSVTATKNGTAASPEKISVQSGDSVVYRLIPASANYSIADVKVDGKSVGTGETLTLSGLSADHKVEVSFRWNNPFSDLNSDYLAAVEYVTEAGVMGAYRITQEGGRTIRTFSGSTNVTVGAVAAALAELADVNGKLGTDDARIEWAKTNGVIGKNQNTGAVCDVQTACAMVKNYLNAVQWLTGISFTDVKAADSAKDTAVKIGMVTSDIYRANRSLNRYDLAAVCLLISGLDY